MKLSIAAELKSFVEKEALPGTGIKPKAFWDTAEKLISEYAPRIAAALEKRAADAMALIRASRQSKSWRVAKPLLIRQ